MSFRNLLKQRADVHRIRYNVSIDDFGQAFDPSDITIFSNIPCRLSQRIIRTGAGVAEREDEVRRFIERNFVCFMGLSMISGNISIIKGDHRLVIDAESYEIEDIFVRSRQSKVHHLELALQKIEPEVETD